MFADVHGRAYFQNRSDILILAGIYICCKFGISEHIGNTVVAHPVTGTEILMCVVIEHAPAKGS